VRPVRTGARRRAAACCSAASPSPARHLLARRGGRAAGRRPGPGGGRPAARRPRAGGRPVPVGRQRPRRVGLLRPDPLWRGVPGVTGMPRVSRDQLEWAVRSRASSCWSATWSSSTSRSTTSPSTRGRPDRRRLLRQGRRGGAAAVEGRRRPLRPGAAARHAGGPAVDSAAAPVAAPGVDPLVGRSPDTVVAAPVGSGSTAERASRTKAARPPPASPSAAKPAPKPDAAAKPVASRQQARHQIPSPSPSASRLRRAGDVPAPLTGLPARQLQLSSRIAYSSAALAKARAGEPAGPGGWTDVELVRTAWRDAGGRPLPADRDAIAALGTPVPLTGRPHRRPGRLRPARRCRTWASTSGAGQMVDASPKQGRVVVGRCTRRGPCASSAWADCRPPPPRRRQGGAGHPSRAGGGHEVRNNGP
jgi:hypothetical protein